MANTTIHICALCRREIKNSGLGIHLNNAHKNQITYQQYFDQFIDSKEHTCICGKPLKFNGLTSGYSKTCGDSKCIHVFQKEGYKNKTGYDYAWQNPECKEKSRKTLKEKTGFEYAMQNPATKQLSKAICLEKYGVENIAQNEEIKVRSENTKEARYGDKHFNNHCKTVKTCLEKYGVENTFQDENFKIKAEKTKKRKYGSSTFHNTEKTKRTCITRYGKPHYAFTQEERQKGNIAKRVKAFKRFLNSNRFKGKATPLFNVEEYTGIWGRYAFECNFCHRIFYSNLIHGGIPRCLKIGRASCRERVCQYV